MRFEIEKDLVVRVPRGSYTITKNVVVDSEVLNSYADQYVASLQDPSSDCYVEQASASFLPAVVFDGCFETCADCEAALLDGKTKTSRGIV